MCCLTEGVLRRNRRRHMRLRLRGLSAEWSDTAVVLPERNVNARQLAARLGARLGQRLPGEVDALAARADRAGLGGGLPALELLGWKALSVALGGAIGLWAVAPCGAPRLIAFRLGVLSRWFLIDL